MKKRNLLIEAMNPEEIRVKYFNDIPKDVFYKITMVDPTSRFKDNQLVKVGAFVKFIIKDYKKGIFKFEDSDRYTEYIDLYVKNRKRKELKDFNVLNIDGIQDLIKKLQFLKGETTGSIYDLLQLIEEGVDYVEKYDGNDWFVFQPLTEKGACTLGYGTEWCTAWGPLSLDKNKKTRTNLFKHYKNNLFVLVSKETMKPEWQIHLDSEQFMDKYDTNLFNGSAGGYKDVEEFLNKNAELTYYVFPILKNLDENNINKSNISELTKIINYLPEKYKNKVNELTKEYIPIEIIEKINRINVNPLDDDVYSEIINYLFYGKCFNSVDRSGIHFEAANLEEFDVLFSAVNTDSMDWDSDFANDSYDDVMANVNKKVTEDPNNELNKLFKKVTIIGFNSKNLIEILNDILDDKTYAKLKEDIVNEIAAADLEARKEKVGEVQGRLYSKWDRSFFDRSSSLIFKEYTQFANYLIYFLIGYNYELGDKYEINQFVDYYNMLNNLPSDIHDFYDLTGNVNINYEELYNNIIFMIDSKVADYIKDNGATNEKIAYLRSILNDLKFDSSGVFEDENHIVTIDVKSADYNNKKIKIKIVDKQGGSRPYEAIIPFDSIADYVKNYRLYEQINNIKRVMFG
jgi:hypothetical protein